jgi:valine dehydrogenase (NAD+)
VGRNKAAGGSGDSGFSTAYGVLCSMRAAASILWGSAGLDGRTVGVEGAGKVGFHLVGLLLQEGARVVVSDPFEPARQRVLNRYEGVSTETNLIGHPLDVYAPCALGATLTEDTVAALQARLVCGAANNQLLHQGVGRDLAARDILWVPDFVANAGGLIQVGGELENRTEQGVLEDVRNVGKTVTQILRYSTESRVPTAVAALEIVKGRLEAARHPGFRHG